MKVSNGSSYLEPMPQRYFELEEFVLFSFLEKLYTKPELLYGIRGNQRESDKGRGKVSVQANP